MHSIPIAVIIGMMALTTQGQHVPSPPRNGEGTTTGQDSIPPPPRKKAESLGDLLNTRKLLMGRNIIGGDLGHSMGRLVYVDQNDFQEKKILRSATMLNLRVKPWRELQFTGSFFAYHTKDIATNVPWIADYFYALKWSNWRPKTFSYGYENWMDNRFDDPDGFGDKFLQGYWFVSWNHDLPENLTRRIRLDATSRVNVSYHARYFFQYRDEFNRIYGVGLDGWGKAMLGANVRWTIVKRIYVEAAAYYYPEQEVTQVMWDPDFTYGFGYFDWRPFRFSLTYGNWVMNRFPWNIQEVRPEYGILDGDLRFSFSWNW